MKDLIFEIYEDKNLMEKVGEEFHISIKSDIFVMLTVGFPEKYPITKEEKEALHRIGEAVVKCFVPGELDYDPVIPFTTQVSILIYAPGETRMRTLMLEIEKVALSKTEELLAGKPVRIGEGNMGGGFSGIKDSYAQSIRAIKAGAIFKAGKMLLRYGNMEIYSILDEIIRTHGKRLSQTVLGLLSDRERQILSCYYECKENADRVAAQLSMPPEQVTGLLRQVKEGTGLDVNDSEDSFKLHLVVLCDKVQKYIDEREK